MDIATVGLLAYALVALVVMVDSILPLVPSEALVVAAAGASATGSLSIVGVVAAAAAGAFAGDVAVHMLGRYAGQRWNSRLGRTRGWSKAMELVRDMGPGVVMIGRYVPLGRTAVAFMSGTSGLTWRRYLPAAAAGAVLWALVMTALGRIAPGLTGNMVFTLGLGVVASVAIGLIASVVLRRRGQSESRRAVVIAATSADRFDSGAVGSCGRLAMASRFLPNGGWGTSRCTARLIGTMTRS